VDKQRATRVFNNSLFPFDHSSARIISFAKKKKQGKSGRETSASWEALSGHLAGSHYTLAKQSASRNPKCTPSLLFSVYKTNDNGNFPKPSRFTKSRLFHKTTGKHQKK
jgi:hypothetical protein